MKSPQLGQHVWVESLDGTFVVVGLHQSEALTDLRSLDGMKAFKPNMPFITIRELGGERSQTSSD
jgi:hypothetical protein